VIERIDADLALERLAEDPEQQAIRDRHFEHYLQVIERQQSKLSRPREGRGPGSVGSRDRKPPGRLAMGLEGASPLTVRLVGLLADY
jgi:hypothetical protein